MVDLVGMAATLVSGCALGALLVLGKSRVVDTPVEVLVALSLLVALGCAALFGINLAKERKMGFVSAYLALFVLVPVGLIRFVWPPTTLRAGRVVGLGGATIVMYFAVSVVVAGTTALLAAKGN